MIATHFKVSKDSSWVPWPPQYRDYPTDHIWALRYPDGTEWNQERGLFDPFLDRLDLDKTIEESRR